MRATTKGSIVLMLFAAAVFFVEGCSGSSKPGDKKGQADKKGDDKEEGGHGWWCEEHGIPEEECSACDAKLEKEYKAKGDWCEKHYKTGRAKSQCFVCNPDKKEFYAAKYRAKYGKAPPPITEKPISTEKDDPKKGDKKQEQ